MTEYKIDNYYLKDMIHKVYFTLNQLNKFHNASTIPYPGAPLNDKQNISVYPSALLEAIHHIERADVCFRKWEKANNANLKDSYWNGEDETANKPIDEIAITPPKEESEND